MKADDEMTAMIDGWIDARPEPRPILTIHTSESGRVTAKLRDITTPFTSRLAGDGATRLEALTHLVIKMRERYGAAGLE